MPARDRLGVVIRCDGSPTIGLGHVVRCLALARELRDRRGRSVVFAMRDGQLGIAMVRDAGFPVLESPAGAAVSDVSWLQEAVQSATAGTLVLDSRDALALDDVRAVRERTGVRVAVIDDASEVRLAADDAFYPPVPQVQALEWPAFAGRVHTGWEWVVLRPEFAAEPRRSRHDPPVVLVTMGGTDPAGLTLQAVRAVAHVPGPLECILLLGPGFSDEAALGGLLTSFPHRSAIVRDGDVRAAMLGADLAVLSFGVTAYEAAACALPSIHLSLTDDHALSSSAFERAGLAVSLGRADEVEEARLSGIIGSLLADPARRAAMGDRARRLVDGNGAARVAEVIAAGGPV